MAFLISIPTPPSVNALYANRKYGRGRGRYKTKKYEAWIEAAGWEIVAQAPKPVRGKYKLFLTLPKTRGDIGNREKAVSDLLVSMHLIDDDKHAVAIHIAVAPELKCATVSVEEA